MSQFPAAVITLMTDFGTCDSYVGEMKGVLLRLAPRAAVVDITHDVPPQNVQHASVLLDRVLRAFSPGTIHVVVVDPEVGSQRNILVAMLAEQTIICPDNGLLTWSWRRLSGGSVGRLKQLPATASGTFHGRDVFAPLAAHLADRSATDLIKPLESDQIRWLDLAPATSPARQATVILIDQFGNCITNVPGDLITGQRVSLHDRLLPVQRTYADVPAGEPVAVIGSCGLLEIAVRNGSAAEQFRLKVGDPLALV